MEIYLPNWDYVMEKYTQNLRHKKEYKKLVNKLILITYWNEDVLDMLG